MFFITLLVCFVCNSLAATVENPFKTCDTKDANFEQCFGQSIQEAIASLRDGNKELGVIPVDPIEIPSLLIPGHGSVNFDQNYKNIKVLKLSHGTVTKASWNKDDKIISFQYLIPEGVLDSEYEINGKILLLPIQGKGHCVISLHDITTDHTLKYEEKENKNGDKIFKIIDYKMKMSPKLAHYNLENLFNGNKELGDNVLNVMNENWEVIFGDVKESYEEWFSNIFMSYAKRIFNKIAAKDIFIE